MTVRRRPQLIGGHELYLNVVHRAELRREITEWRAASTISPYCDTETARLLELIIEGLLLQFVMEDVRIFRSDVEGLSRRIIASTNLPKAATSCLVTLTFPPVLTVL